MEPNRRPIPTATTDIINVKRIPDNKKFRTAGFFSMDRLLPNVLID